MHMLILGYVSYLLGFHVYITYKGITTYEYILSKRRENVCDTVVSQIETLSPDGKIPENHFMKLVESEINKLDGDESDEKDKAHRNNVSISDGMSSSFINY